MVHTLTIVEPIWPMLQNISKALMYMYMYMEFHGPIMLAKGVATINKQPQQTSSHNGLENIKAATLA